MSSPPRHFQLFQLPLKAVLLRCLNEDGNEVSHASGFLRKVGDRVFLYTCWHTVTGYDRNDLRIGHELPNRAYLDVEMQGAESRQPGVTAIGGIQRIRVPLYDTSVSPKKPRWEQDARHIPNGDLNAIGLFVPFWHDVVRIELPGGLSVSSLQLVEEDDAFPQVGATLVVGDKLYVVGYPYGFSTMGVTQPTPIVLTRFVAAINIAGRQRDILLDGAGAPGMSGGPVFVERGTGIHLLGLYTGLVYPDHWRQQNEKTTALGTCSDLSLHLWDALPLVLEPSES